jgi:hypothetical protein
MNTMKGGFLGDTDQPSSDNPADPPAGTRMTASTNGSPGTSDGTGAAAEPPPPATETADPVPEPTAAVAETLDEMAALPVEPSPPANGTAPNHEPAPVENEHT